MDRLDRYMGSRFDRHTDRRLGMGTRRPRTRQDLGPGRLETLQLRSRDFLYITQPCMNIGRLII